MRTPKPRPIAMALVRLDRLRPTLAGFDDIKICTAHQQGQVQEQCTANKHKAILQVGNPEPRVNPDL